MDNEGLEGGTLEGDGSQDVLPLAEQERIAAIIAVSNDGIDEIADVAEAA